VILAGSIGGSGPVAVTVTGAGNATAIEGGPGGLIVADSGTGSVIFEGSGPLFVTETGTNAQIVADGMATINASNASPMVFGTASADVVYNNNGPGTGTFVAGSGNETLNASGSTGPMLMFGSGDPSGNRALIGGAGNDAFVSGVGSDTMTGGAGSNVFDFIKQGPGGASDVITDITAADLVHFVGYGQTASALLNAATLTAQGIKLTLSDATTVTFANVTTASQLNTLIESDGAPCFASGTHILTECGEVPVEQLRAGDIVRTAGGATRPIVWIGCRRIDLVRHPDPKLVQPIRTRAHAFGEGLPRRDLLLSPDHAVLCNGVLIPVRPLVNGASIVRETGWRAVTYFHVELDVHDIVLAEGLPAESYLDTGNRWMFQNAGVAMPLHPDLAHDMSRRHAESCLPLVCDATRVEPVWRRLAQRAEQLGLRLPPAGVTIGDPALCLLAEGRRILPVSTANGRYVFVLPRDQGVVRLMSRCAVPSATTPWTDERRRLGVMVRALVLRVGSAIKPIPLDHPALHEGWWAPERNGPSELYRWTNGSAVLPLPGELGAPCLLEVDVAGTVAYPLAIQLSEQRAVA
jgi:hypothetical protein